MGKFLMITGAILLLVGVIIHFSGKIPFLGKLPGDIAIDRGNFKFYFPLTTSIIVSVLITLILFLIQRFKN